MRILTSTQALVSSSPLHFHFARFLSSPKSSLPFFGHLFCASTPRAAKLVKVNRNICAMAKPEDARKPPALPLPPLSTTKFKIALCQLSVTEDKERNIAHARAAIEAAADKGAQLIVLPEIWNGPYSNVSFPVYAEDIDAGGSASPSTSMLSEVARSKGITIVGGSISERSGNHLYNTCCIFGKDGELKAKHRKIHLFDIDIPGKISFKESKTLTPGNSPTVVETDVGRIGIGICYDIRFQELAMLYAARGKSLLSYKSKDLYNQVCHSNFIAPRLNKQWWVQDLEVRWQRCCQVIWKTRTSLKHKVMGWLVIHRGLAVKARLNKTGSTDAFCMVCGKEETVDHMFWKCLTARGLWGWLQAEFNSFLLLLSLGKGLF